MLPRKGSKRLKCEDPAIRTHSRTLVFARTSPPNKQRYRPCARRMRGRKRVLLCKTSRRPDWRCTNYVARTNAVLDLLASLPPSVWLAVLDLHLVLFTSTFACICGAIIVGDCGTNGHSLPCVPAKAINIVILRAPKMRVKIGHFRFLSEKNSPKGRLCFSLFTRVARAA